MGQVRNFLFIMCDQLRADYLSCYGHPTLETPHIDALAKRGVKFTRAYCQSPVCGPSRGSFYTGRYMLNHGVTWNNVPTPVGELTLGDYMRAEGVRTALVAGPPAARSTSWARAARRSARLPAWRTRRGAGTSCSSRPAR